jgi:D-arabinose 1-dehydrogenase-like Zn-dependent alcohol dehydrogenase
LIEYHLIGKEVLETDTGECLLPVMEDMGYAESSVLEPWGCVMGAYTQRRRLSPKAGGTMWIIGQPGDTTNFVCSQTYKPAVIVLTDVPDSIKQVAKSTGAKIVERNGLGLADYAAFNQELTNDMGFDDIIVLNPVSAEAVGQIARYVARRGTFNMAGTRPLDGLVEVDFGRLHYDYIAFVGTNVKDLAASYGETRNRCELRAGGTAVFVGAGGPMG